MDRDKAARLVNELTRIGEIDRCRTCGCYVDVLRQVQEDLFARGAADLPEAEALDAMLGRALAERSHECLGCDPCLPVAPFNAFNDLARKGEANGACCDAPCAGSGPREAPAALRGTSEAPAGVGWPPLPGRYEVRDRDAAGAVCTLADEGLYEALREERLPGVALVGMLATENLGIERIVRNVVAGRRVSWLLLCGADSKGHRAGECLAALAANGVDGEMRIVGAPGMRPRLLNLSPAEVEAFRRAVRVVARIGLADPGAVSRIAEEEGRAPWAGRADAMPVALPEEVRVSRRPAPAVDPSGYFVIDVHAERGAIRLEHHAPDHRVTTVLVGEAARDLYLAAVDKGLVTRPDHAAYLGYELGKAERALIREDRYVQDRYVERG